MIRFLTTDEALRPVNASDAEFRSLVRAALFTGCRCSKEVTQGDTHPRLIELLDSGCFSMNALEREGHYP